MKKMLAWWFPWKDFLKKYQKKIASLLDYFISSIGIKADTALRLSFYFGNSAKFWLGLQDDYDIEQESLAKNKEFKLIIPSRSKVA